MTLNIELPDDDVTALRAKAERLGVSAEAYARQVIEKDLKEHGARRKADFRHVSQVLAEVMADVPLDAPVRQNRLKR
jgi:hypothetical protein